MRFQRLDPRVTRKSISFRSIKNSLTAIQHTLDFPLKFTQGRNFYMNKNHNLFFSITILSFWKSNYTGSIIVPPPPTHTQLLLPCPAPRYFCCTPIFPRLTPSRRRAMLSATPGGLQAMPYCGRSRFNRFLFIRRTIAVGNRRGWEGVGGGLVTQIVGKGTGRVSGWGFDPFPFCHNIPSG